MRTFEIPSTLNKAVSSGGQWLVGGVASSFHRDLDGEAITPDAVRKAIPEFMAQRGPDGIQGGPIRLHHDFWQKFLRQAIDGLNLPLEKQMELVAAIALPLGRVTQMWVDDEGTTHWRGALSQSNPIARIIWQMLKEGLVHLGVSLGGKIFATQSNGRDALGRLCNLITSIRIDELSCTDNPALRLVNNEGTGAYIAALSKSVQTAIAPSLPSPTSHYVKPKTLKPRKTMPTLKPKAKKSNIESFLRKALGGDTELRSMGMSRDLGQPKSSTPKGSGSIQMDAAPLKTGAGGKTPPLNKPAGKGEGFKTDVWGMTIKEFTRELSKACSACKAADCSGEGLAKAETQDMLMKGAFGLTHAVEYPPDDLVNFVRFLQKLAMHASQIPSMSDWERGSLLPAMASDLSKALEEFEEKMPEDLKSKPLRAPGSPGVPSHIEIVFPQQYNVN